MCRGARSPNNAAVRIIWAAAFYCLLAPPSAAPRLLWRDCFPRTMVPHSTCLLFLAFSWSWQLLKSTFVLAELLKLASSWSYPIFPFDTAHHLPALFPKSPHLLVTLSPTGGRFQYRQVQLKAENSKTACIKLDFSRPNSNWTAFSAMRAYQNPLGLSQYATKAPSPHRKAHREAAANALAHRTWDVGANATIVIHGSSIVMASPGGLPSGATRFDTPASVPRTWTAKTNCARGTVSTAVPLPPNTLQANKATPARTYSIRHIPIPRRRRRSSCRPG